MNNKNEVVFVVDYAEGSSVIHEYMSDQAYQNLIEQEKSGFVQIMNHKNILAVQNA